MEEQWNKVRVEKATEKSSERVSNLVKETSDEYKANKVIILAKKMVEAEAPDKFIIGKTEKENEWSGKDVTTDAGRSIEWITTEECRTKESLQEFPSKAESLTYESKEHLQRSA